MQVALIGHTCSPHHGSEPGVTWNWATQLARHHDVTLITHPLYRPQVDEVLARNPVPRLKIHWLTTSHPLDRWEPGASQRGLRLHYRLWQDAVLKTLRELHATRPFDLVHVVSWASLQQPPVAWKIGLPFVWGPLGGGQVWPAPFLDFAGKSRNSERLRRLIVRLTPLNRRVTQAVRHADLILGTNRETMTLLNRLGARRVEYFADYGIQPSWLEQKSTTRSSNGRLNLLFAGRCEPRKGLPLVLDAMAQTSASDVRLVAAGEGPCRPEWQARAKDLGLNDRVQFLGEVPWARMDQLFQEADAFVFPSLRDSQGTVVLEAMARRLPLLTLDHQGVSCVVPTGAAIKVPVTTPAETINGLAAGMATLSGDPLLRVRMGEEAAACVARQTWEARASKMCQWYDEVVHAHRTA